MIHFLRDEVFKKHKQNSIKFGIGPINSQIVSNQLLAIVKWSGYTLGIRLLCGGAGGGEGGENCQQQQIVLNGSLPNPNML